jgi:hypothetical protein
LGWWDCSWWPPSSCNWRGSTTAEWARRFERANPQIGTRLTNAVQLADQKCDSDVGEFLRAEAIALGRRTAAQVQTAPLMKRGVWLALAAVVCVALGWLAFVRLGDDVFQVVLLRFTDVRGDHPPFSRLQFEVTPARSEVLYGNQLEVRATARGRPVDKLWVVARNTTNETRSTMFLAPDRSFFQTLVNLREPTEFFVTDGKARSKRFPDCHSLHAADHAGGNDHGLSRIHGQVGQDGEAER